MNDTTLKHSDRGITRWHQEPIAWLVFGLPAAVVVASFVTLYIAMYDHPDALVVDDYYKEGLEINKVLEREDAAHLAGLAFTPELAADGRITLRFVANPGFAFPEHITLKLNHATEGGHDQSVELAHGGNGVYAGKLARLAEGPWYIDASTREWRAVKRVNVDSDGRMVQ